MKATNQQINWLARIKGNVDALHNQWYGFETGFDTFGNSWSSLPLPPAARGERGIDQELFVETDRKIREACHRLDLRVIEAFDEDGWDGEQYGPLVTLWDALRDIRHHFGLPRY